MATAGACALTALISACTRAETTVPATANQVATSSTTVGGATTSNEPDPTTSTNTPPRGAAPSDPSPARPCDGQEVRCVDATGADADADGTSQRPHRTVTAAIAAARSGTVIQVADGTYDGSVVLDSAEDVSIVGGFPAGGDFTTRDTSPGGSVLRGDGDRPVVRVVGSSRVRIEGLRLTGGGGGGADGSSRRGGGVDIDGTSTDVAVVGNRIDGNAVDRGDDPTASRGGGIASDGTGTTIVANTIEGNRAGRGAGVAADGDTIVQGNVVRDNTSVGDHGGGLYLSGRPTVIDNRVTGNRVGTEYSWGGGIIVFNDGTTAELRGNVVSGNTALSAGSGVFVDDGADATLRNELYADNTCSENGGDGLFVDSGGSTPTVVDAANITIAGHACPGSQARAVLAETGEAGAPRTSVTIADAILWGNGDRPVEAVDADVIVSFTLSETRLDGEGNLAGDPQFVDAAGGDFRLRPTSPAVDAGNPASSADAERSANGGRIDLGSTGGTAAAGGGP